MLNDPASSPAIPASRMNRGSAAVAAPATPMTSARLLTRPSLTPKMTARSVPDRAPVRCQFSDAPISDGAIARPARATPSRPATLTIGGRLRVRGHGRHPGCAAVAELVPDPRVLALVGGDRGDLGRLLGVVRLLLVALERDDHVGDGLGPEEPGEQDDEADARPRPLAGRHVGAELAQLVRPDLGVAALVAGDPVERPGADRILLDARERVVQDDGVALELQVVEAALDIDRGHASMVVRLAAVRRVPDVLRSPGHVDSATSCPPLPCAT